jgi:hypothetical protein
MFLLLLLVSLLFLVNLLLLESANVDVNTADGVLLSLPVPTFMMLLSSVAYLSLPSDAGDKNLTCEYTRLYLSLISKFDNKTRKVRFSLLLDSLQLYNVQVLAAASGD